MSSAAVGTHSGTGGPLSLMSCVRESSPLQDYEVDGEKNVATKKKFWNPKKWFKRKNKDVETVVQSADEKDVLRSRSTSELSITEEHTRRRSGSSMHLGLSVSHDSVFHSPNSGSDIDLDQAQSVSSLSNSQPQIDLRLQTELSERLRLRRGRGDTSEDDEGLPHSPCNSPTTTEVLLDKTAIKDLPTKSHSTCSDGSLLSMGSSEMDEESFSQPSRHSSKISLHEKKIEINSDVTSTIATTDLELGASVPLNHSAAHHRVAVRPKRRAPGRKRGSQLSSALPTTLEVNEESSVRSLTPEVSRETELYSMSSRTTFTETQLKCSSLPPGLVAPGGLDPKLSRSRSNAGSKSHEHFAALEEDVEKEEKTDKSFFDRIFPRRSAKKKKSKEEKIVSKEERLISTTNSSIFIQTSSQSYSNHRVEKSETKPIAAPRSGAAARQRVQPIDLPASPEANRRDFESLLPKPSPGTSPLQAELEHRFKQRQSVSPPNFEDDMVIIKQHSEMMRKEAAKHEEIRVKIPGLSSLQQRVLSHRDEIDDGFKSLNDLPPDDKIVAKPVAKSHSFKSTKPKFEQQTAENHVNQKNNHEYKFRASSLDSVKHLDEIDDDNNKKNKKIETTNTDEVKMNTIEQESIIKPEFHDVTISGPSHTAVVNVSSNTTVDTYQQQSSMTKSKIESNSSNSHPLTTTDIINEKIKEVTMKESVSITKIQLKRESTQITQNTVTVPKNQKPEFLNRQLNKVEQRSSSNVVFSTNSPRIVEEQSRPKTVFTFQEVGKEIPRKFSQEDIEIIEKTPDDEQPKSLITNNRYKKNDTKTRKPSTSSIESPKISGGKPEYIRSRSVSLDSLKADESSDKSSQDSLDKVEEKTDETRTKEKTTTTTVMESVVLRKKSLVKQKADEEPELMKVFARRSLKLKDSDCDTINQQISSDNCDNKQQTRDSDKENQETDSPKEERRKSITVPIIKSELIETTNNKREPLTETKESEKFIETAEVTLRKPSNVIPYQRAVSIPSKTQELDSNKSKKTTINERRRYESWSTNNVIKNNNLDELKISQDEIILSKSDLINEDLITETKNFNQRKAEWEKRAQEAQKKSVP